MSCVSMYTLERTLMISVAGKKHLSVYSVSKHYFHIMKLTYNTVNIIITIV